MCATRVTKAFFPKKAAQPGTSRKSRSHFLARRPISKLHSHLMAHSSTEWPPHFRDAWQLLKSESELPDDRARSLVLKATSAAQQCGKVQSEELRHSECFRARHAINIACCRIANTINRAPARVRRRLDQAITALIREPVLDFEVLAAICRATLEVFRTSRDLKLTRPVLRAFGKIKVAHYEALDMQSRNSLEAALTALTIKLRAPDLINAADVFTAAARVLGAGNKRQKTSSRRLLKDYVAKLSEIWREEGLKPSRAVSYLNEAYRSKFHRFAELIFVGVLPPSVLQHRTRQLPGEREPSRAMQKRDYQWSISDDHVRAALR